jgi:enoyl-CoA hydratase/carnithine racemase
VEHVRVEIEDRIATVTLDRPPVNALTHQTFLELTDAFDQLSASRDASVAVLRATGERAFCAGVDLNDSPRRHRPDGRLEDGGPQIDPRHQVDPGRAPRDCFWSIYDCSIPVIAAVDGPAIGAGAAIVASCDLVIASHRASLALTEINIGVLGGAKHAQRMLGPFLAKRMFLTGEFVGADALYRRGALEEAVAPEELMSTALQLARTIASKSPIALRLAKESANRVEYMDLKAGYRTEQDYTTRVRRYADSEEARVAWLEKRAPGFRWE